MTQESEFESMTQTAARWGMTYLKLRGIIYQHKMYPKWKKKKQSRQGNGRGKDICLYRIDEVDAYLENSGYVKVEMPEGELLAVQFSAFLGMEFPTFRKLVDAGELPEPIRVEKYGAVLRHIYSLQDAEEYARVSNNGTILKRKPVRMKGLNKPVSPSVEPKQTFDNNFARLFITSLPPGAKRMTGNGTTVRVHLEGDGAY